MTKNDSFDSLVEKYKNYAKVHFEVDYGDKKSVKKGNQAARDMRRIAYEINELYMDKIERFAELLSEGAYKKDIWVAHHILECMNYSREIEKKALNVIEKYSMGDSAEALGNKMWLKDWKSKKGYL